MHYLTHNISLLYIYIYIYIFFFFLIAVTFFSSLHARLIITHYNDAVPCICRIFVRFLLVYEALLVEHTRPVAFSSNLALYYFKQYSCSLLIVSYSLWKQRTVLHLFIDQRRVFQRLPSHLNCKQYGLWVFLMLNLILAKISIEEGYQTRLAFF